MKRDMLIERLAQAVDILRRNWLALLLPLLISVPIAAIFVKMAPNKYVAKSIVLLQSANQGNPISGAIPRQNVIEQVAVLEAWLKSDHILDELLPELRNGPPPTSPQAQVAERAILFSALKLELVGNAVLEVRLEGSEAKGLGRKLEIIVTKLLEGVLNPDEGLLSAEQLILARRGEATAEAEKLLKNAVSAANIGPLDVVKSKLRTIQQLQLGHTKLTGSGSEVASINLPTNSASDSNTGQSGKFAIDDPEAADQAEALATVDRERNALSPDRAVVENLEKLYANYELLQTSLDALLSKSRSAGNTYVGIFDAPERLTIIGRPRDPLVGEKYAKKLAIGFLMVLMISTAGLVLLSEFLDPRLYIRDDYEKASGLQVIARLPRIGREPLRRERTRRTI